MAIEDIFKALEEQGEAEVRETIDAARGQASGIEEDAKAEADRIRQSRIDAARSHVQSRVARVINAAKLDARRTTAGVKEQAIEAAYEAALSTFDGLRGSADYDGLFSALAAEAAGGVEGEVVLLVDPADEQRARAALSSLGLPGSVEATLSTRGGLTLAAQGGTMLRRNTVEDRLEKFRAFGQASVAEALFS